MPYFAIAMILLLGVSTILFAVGRGFFVAGRYTGWRKWANSVGCILLMVGMVGFAGNSFSSFGGLNWLPQSFEWPAGYVRGVVFTHNGLAVVPHVDSGRVQLYGSDWRFVRGWHIGSPHQFRLRISDEDHIEVLTAKSYWHKVFDLQGEMLSQTKYPTPTQREPSFYDTYPDRGVSVFVPTRPWLLLFSNHGIAWAVSAMGMVLLGLTRRGSSEGP